MSFVDSMSSEDVTGSNVFIKTPNYKILLDCGMYQSNDKKEDYLINNRKTKEYKPKELDYIFITHNHCDHMALLPLYYKRGFRGNIIVANGSKEIMKDMLLDCAWICERDALVLEKEPLFTESDVFAMLEYVKEFSVNDFIELNEELSFQLIPSGHLLNSSQIMLYINNNNVMKTICYTGDIGNSLVENYYVGKLEKIKNCDLLIGESTYGDRKDLKVRKKERKIDLDKLQSIIDMQIFKMHGKLIIPVFAQSRCPSILTMIYKLYKDKNLPCKVYVDSPLAIKLLNDYVNVLQDNEKELLEEILSWDKLVLVKESDDSKVLVSSNESKIVLSTSGMMINGRIRHHFKSIVSDPNATILFCGYATDGSLASLLKDPKRKEIEIDGKIYNIKCSSQSLKSMSGHATFEILLDYYSNVNCNKIILHHGSKESKENLSKELSKKIEKECKTTRVICSNSSLKFSL